MASSLVSNRSRTCCTDPDRGCAGGMSVGCAHPFGVRALSFPPLESGRAATQQRRISARAAVWTRCGSRRCEPAYPFGRRCEASAGGGRAAAGSLPITSTRRVPAKVAASFNLANVIRPAYLVLYLFRPFPHYQRGSLSTRSIDVSVPMLISDDG